MKNFHFKTFSNDKFGQPEDQTTVFLSKILTKNKVKFQIVFQYSGF